VGGGLAVVVVAGGVVVLVVVLEDATVVLVVVEEEAEEEEVAVVLAVALVLVPTLRVLVLVELGVTGGWGERVVVVGAAVVVVTVPLDVVGGSGAFGKWAAHAGRARARLAKATKATAQLRRRGLGNGTCAPLTPARRWRSRRRLPVAGPRRPRVAARRHPKVGGTG
jgi:hypothetical protein